WTMAWGSTASSAPPATSRAIPRSPPAFAQLDQRRQHWRSPCRAGARCSESPTSSRRRTARPRCRALSTSRASFLAPRERKQREPEHAHTSDDPDRLPRKRARGRRRNVRRLLLHLRQEVLRHSGHAFGGVLPELVPVERRLLRRLLARRVDAIAED